VARVFIIRFCIDSLPFHCDIHFAGCYRLLKESLGGNSQTAMLATISPSSAHIEDTLSTLRYAKQARTIVNVARVNEDATARLVRGKKGVSSIKNICSYRSIRILRVLLASFISQDDYRRNNAIQE